MKKESYGDILDNFHDDIENMLERLIAAGAPQLTVHAFGHAVSKVTIEYYNILRGEDVMDVPSPEIARLEAENESLRERIESMLWGKEWD